MNSIPNNSAAGVVQNGGRTNGNVHQLHKNGKELSRLGQTARQYAQLGYPVFPCKPNSKVPCGELVPNGYLGASTDEETIIQWWQQNPNANIGVSCKDLAVIDIDRKPGKTDGVENFSKLKGWEATAAETPVAKTPNDGRHVFYLAPKDPVKGKIPGVGEVKHNGYVIVAPSVVDGKEYVWCDGYHSLLAYELHQLPELPHWLLRHVLSDTADGCDPACATAQLSISEKDRALVRDALTFIPADDYDVWLNVGMALHAAGFSVEGWDEWSQKSDKYEAGACEAKWKTFKRTGITFRTIFFHASSHGFRLPSDYYGFDDIDNARRFVDSYGDRIRWYAAEKRWYVWDGKRWKVDEHEQALAYAMETARSIYKEAAACADDDRRKYVIAWAKTSASAAKLEAMLKLAKPHLSITADMFDCDTFKLNCLNGTLDLSTGELKPHQKSDFITKLVPVNYNPSALAPRFIQLLGETFADSQGLIDFVQCVLGYALTGSVKEQKLFLCCGSGANGKSTLFNAVRALLGDYAQETDPTLLLNKRNDGGATEDVYRLRGVRLATTLESEENVKVNEVRLKQLTGGDRITARPLYGHFAEFDPTHKLFLITNHLPRIRSQGEAIWRRIRMIPFAVKVPDHKKDKDLPDKLRAEYEGILAWLVQGCLKWLAEGLPEPPEVINATGEYKTHEDSLEQFIEDCCVRSATATIQSSALRDAYREWCRKSGETELNRNQFSNRLREKGITSKGTNKANVWQGIKLVGGDTSVGDWEA